MSRIEIFDDFDAMLCFPGTRCYPVPASVSRRLGAVSCDVRPHMLYGHGESIQLEL